MPVRDGHRRRKLGRRNLRERGKRGECQEEPVKGRRFSTEVRRGSGECPRGSGEGKKKAQALEMKSAEK
jgi:hypothetical protein